jgi:hypothetical protein
MLNKIDFQIFKFCVWPCSLEIIFNVGRFPLPPEPVYPEFIEGPLLFFLPVFLMVELFYSKKHFMFRF